ncbi:MAG TPA: transketolase C-terminal domain-containing protein, partial [Propionibacteriaceae bacterium]|nr:transketolase C-terminal domain-containing protein [Propionibacteriaceae bacterium]
NYAFAPGAVHQLRQGGDLALVSTGAQTSRVLQAADQLQESGTSATVVHVPSLKPLDAKALVAAIGAAPQVVTVEEHSVHGGLGGLVAEVLTSAGNSPRIERIGLDDVWGESADNDFLLDKHGLSPERIADRVRNLLPAGSRA